MAEADKQADGADAPSDDFVKPWTIKGIEPAVRNAALEAAKRERMQIGQWVTRAITSYIQSDRAKNRLPAVVGAEVAKAGGDLSDIERLVAMARDLADVAPGVSRIAKSTRNLGLQMVRDRLEAIRKSDAAAGKSDCPAEKSD